MQPPVSAPEIDPDELARRLDAGEALQVLDVRAPERLAQGRVTLGAALDFRNVPGSRLYAAGDASPAGLDPARPVAVVCGHGNSSRAAAAFLRGHGFEAFSVTGGMAGWETVYVPRRLDPPPGFDALLQLDRVGKGALSYVVASGGEALVVDPGRHVARYEAALAALGARPVAVLDTHAHADYVSGGPACAERWRVPYFLHPEDAVSPYDARPARIRAEPLAEGRTVACGRASVAAQHTPGHTLGSVTLWLGEGAALTGDFLFVRSVGRPDLGGQGPAWARLLWRSLERARRAWPRDAVILPAHYAGEHERASDRTVGAPLAAVLAENAAAAITTEAEFLAWVARHAEAAPPAYRTIKLANLGLEALSEADADALESGPNRCAVPGTA